MNILFPLKGSKLFLIWKILAQNGYAPLSIAMLRKFHDGTSVRV